MSDEIKRAIKSAQERLDQETNERLTNEIHEYLREELDSIERLKKQKEEIDTKIRVHEENVKNVKTGNLEAIEKRRQATVSLNLGGNLITWSTTFQPPTGYRFYDNYVAGFTYTSPLTGRTYIF